MPKYKITKSIIDTNKNIVGFVIQAKACDLGGFPTETNVVEKAMPINALRNMNGGVGFRNYQLAITPKGIAEQSNFKINALPMVMFDGQQYTPVDNKITIVSRYERDGKNIGFDVSFGDGTTRAMNYSQLIQFSKWFKPSNFMVSKRTDDNGANGKSFIKGKNMIIDNLPCKTITSNGTVETKGGKRTKTNAQPIEKKFSASLVGGADIIDIYGLIESVNGFIINLPGEKYTAKSASTKDSSIGFVSAGIGEVASPKLEFNYTKLNLNAGFKKVGTVYVDLGANNQTPIPTYIYRTKSLFYSGESYMKNFAIAVPTEEEELVIKLITKSFAAEKITDQKVTDLWHTIIGKKKHPNLVFYKVSGAKLELISKDKRQKSILTDVQLVELLKRQFKFRLISKYAGPRGGVMKELKAKLGAVAIGDAENKEIADTLFWAKGNDAMIQKLTELGFNVYTGAYNKQDHGEALPTGKSDGEGGSATAVEITYTLKDFNADKITYAAMKANHSKLPSEVIDAIEAIESVADEKQKYLLADKYYKDAEKELAAIAKILWKHNASMYIEGAKTKIYSHESANWESVATRSKNANAYVNKKMPELSVKLSGVVI